MAPSCASAWRRHSLKSLPPPKKSRFRAERAALGAQRGPPPALGPLCPKMHRGRRRDHLRASPCSTHTTTEAGVVGARVCIRAMDGVAGGCKFRALQLAPRQAVPPGCPASMVPIISRTERSWICLKLASTSRRASTALEPSSSAGLMFVLLSSSSLVVVVCCAVDHAGSAGGAATRTHGQGVGLRLGPRSTKATSPSSYRIWTVVASQRGLNGESAGSSDMGG